MLSCLNLPPSLLTVTSYFRPRKDSAASKADSASTPCVGTSIAWVKQRFGTKIEAETRFVSTVVATSTRIASLNSRESWKSGYTRQMLASNSDYRAQISVRPDFGAIAVVPRLFLVLF